jgi:signal transduction histidine kinase
LSIAEGKQRALAEGLVESTLAVNASLELEEVLKTILEQIHRSIDYRLANIALIEAGDLKVFYQIDRSAETDNSPAAVNQYRLADFPLLELMCSTHQPVLIEDTSIAPEALLIPGLEWPCSYLAAPLIVGERITGVINLTSDHVGAFQPETARRLMAFAAPAALAVENARLYAAELYARQVAEVLNDVSRALTQTLNFDTVINTLLEYVCRLVPSDRAYIVVAENESTLRLQAMCGFDDEPNLKRAINASFEGWDTPYLQEVISTRHSLLIPDTQNYPGWTTLITTETIRNWLGLPILVNDKAIGVLALARSSFASFNAEHVKLAEVVIAQAAMAVQNAWLFEQVRAGHERLQSLSRRLVEVQESERRYIARELHDEASQSLTALKFGLRLLEQEVTQPEAFTMRMAELKTLTEQVLEELHRLAMDLRPASLDYLGLEVALEQLVKDLGERYRLNMRFKVSGFGEQVRLPDYVETNVYRIVQEALTNAVRHANASNIDVILECRDGEVIVIIEDDGIGFETSQMRKSGHLGLLGMQERAQMMAGTLQVESKPGGGTTIVVEIPYVDSHIDR